MSEERRRVRYDGPPFRNLTVATTGTTHGAAMISLPRSQVEMTEWDLQWQEKITKVVRRVAKDLIANDETEISEVVCRRLFQDVGAERVRKRVSKAYADWCFDRRPELPSEWTAVDMATTETKAREYLRSRFETCYPFHPATLSVFQRKWQALPQYQQTRGTLAMLAQWVSLAYKEGFTKARTEPLITLGSAPLDLSEFRSIVLGQLGESRLVAAIDSDISGAHSHARALDADTKGPLRGIHRRVGTSILFESSGGQVEKVAHMPELQFALGEPGMDTTSVHTAALTLEDKSYFIRRVGSDGFKISHQPTMKKVVNDRRASLDAETEILPAMRTLAEKEFRRGASIPVVLFPADGTAIQDTPKLSLVVADPETEWTESGESREQIAAWTKHRGKSPRLYPGSLVWCVKKAGRELRAKVEEWLAWKRVAGEIVDGTLGSDFDRADRSEAQSKVKDAEEAAKDEVWSGYRFAVIADNRGEDGLKVIDLGMGHPSSGETLCGRVVAALKSQALLNESVGAGYIQRNWPPALKESGAWPLASLRQSFLNGSLTRLVDPDTVLRGKIVEFVSKGDFGLASGQKPDGSYERVWFREHIGREEIAFEPGVFLLLKEKAKSLKDRPEVEPEPQPGPEMPPQPPTKPGVATPAEVVPGEGPRTLRVTGSIPPEHWNRLGTKLLPKMRQGQQVTARIDLSATFETARAKSLEEDLRQLLEELGLAGNLRVE